MNDEKYAYEYRYDGRGNVIKKILPGCEYIQYWYDRGDRVSFFQDAALRDNGIYRFFSMTVSEDLPYKVFAMAAIGVKR